MGGSRPYRPGWHLNSGCLASKTNTLPRAKISNHKEILPGLVFEPRASSLKIQPPSHSAQFSHLVALGPLELFQNKVHPCFYPQIRAWLDISFIYFLYRMSERHLTLLTVTKIGSLKKKILVYFIVLPAAALFHRTNK